MKAVIVAVALFAAVANACQGYTNCYDCNYYGSGCGWDSTGAGNLGTCRKGTTSGPTSGTASGTWYYGASSVCPCNLRTTCYACASGNCGWAATSLTTSLGNCQYGYTRPSNTTSANWITTPSSCTCPMFKDCRTCTWYSGCGWDMTAGTGATQAVCKAGSSSGPTTGSATSSNWAYSSCPCKSRLNCDSCIYASGCGWSTVGTARCREGGVWGPTGSTFNNQASGWYYSSCSGSYNWNGAAVAVAAFATWLLIVVILIPLCVCICIIACIVRAVRGGKTEVVVVQGGQPGMNPAYVQA